MVNADLAKYMAEAGASMRSENLSRMEMLHQMNAMFTEAQARQEQLLQTLVVVLENDKAGGGKYSWLSKQRPTHLPPCRW